jgi:hypothetical protein
VGLELLARCVRTGGETLLGDKGYAGRDIRRSVRRLDATIVRPRRKDEPGTGAHLAPIRQRIESNFWTCKDLLTLERHGARTVAGIKEHILRRLLCLAACISLNHQLGRPSRALVDYVAGIRGINHLGPQAKRPRKCDLSLKPSTVVDVDDFQARDLPWIPIRTCQPGMCRERRNETRLPHDSPNALVVAAVREREESGPRKTQGLERCGTPGDLMLERGPGDARKVWVRHRVATQLNPLAGQRVELLGVT